MTGNILLATPRTKPYLDGYVDSLWGTRFKGAILRRAMPNLAVDVARDVLVNKMKEHQLDAILMADVDATWHPDAIQRLWDRDVDIICGIMYRRALPPIPTIGYYKGVNPEQRHVYDLGTFAETVKKYLRYHKLDPDHPNELLFDDINDEPNILPIDGCGMHFTLIRRRVFEHMPPPWFRTVTTAAGEDYYFCRKARELGFKIYADLTVHTGHEAGTGIDFGAREFMAFMKYTDRIETQKEIWDMGPTLEWD